MIPADVLMALRDQAHLVRVIGDAVPLRQAGRELKACCPFHQERTPSFYVVPDKGFWKCFGCGKSGDVIDFVAFRQGCSREEAARQLVDQLNVAVPATVPADWGYKPLDAAGAYLADAGAQVLSALLRHGHYRIDVSQDDAPWGDTTHLYILSPFSHVLADRPDQDKERLLRAVLETDRELPKSLGLGSIEFRDDPIDGLPPADRLLSLVVAQGDLMKAVAKGAPPINDVNDQYKVRRQRIAQLLSDRGEVDPNRHEDLWDWFHHWKREGWGTWAERFEYVDSIYEPLVSRLLTTEREPVPPREPTGWERVDRTLERARRQLLAASFEEDYQAIGLLCREVLISVAQAVFDPAKHPTLDQVSASDTDAGRMLEAFIAATVGGKDHESIRRHAKASLRLALELQHKRTADFRLAALCTEATASCVNVVAILVGRRDPAGHA